MTKSKPKFMLGYNAGSRHTALGIVPPDFSMEEKSDDFKAGYRFGEIDRKAGRMTDNEQATRWINETWNLYEHGAVVVP